MEISILKFQELKSGSKQTSVYGVTKMSHTRPLTFVFLKYSNKVWYIDFAWDKVRFDIF